MNWVWNASIPAWITQVSICGKFLLIKEETINNVVVSVVTLSLCDGSAAVYAICLGCQCTAE